MVTNVSSIATFWNTPQYHGQLLTMGDVETPFLNRLGGMGGGNFKTAKDWLFYMNSQNALEASAQKTIDETTALTAPTPVAYDRGQDYQAVQIFQYGVGATYAAQSAIARLSDAYPLAGDLEDVNDPLASNLDMTLKQMARDVEFHMLRGLYQRSTSAAVASQMRGLFAQTVQGGGAGFAIDSNKVNAGANALTTAHVDAMLLLMEETSFAKFKSPLIVSRYSGIKALCDLYGIAPFAGPMNNIGTLTGAIDTLEINGRKLPMAIVPQMPNHVVGLLDMAYIFPVFLPVPEKNGRPGGLVFYEPLAKTGAADNGQLYGQISIDFTAEELHGQIYGTALF